jgi:hypothetical protein
MSKRLSAISPRIVCSPVLLDFAIVSLVCFEFNVV